MNPLELAANAALEKKAEDLTILEVQDLCSFADHFMICNGNSVRQNQAIAREIEEVLSAGGLKPSHVEGLERGEWILMDYITMVIHVFSPEKRSFYDLEHLWADAPRVPPPA